MALGPGPRAPGLCRRSGESHPEVGARRCPSEAPAAGEPIRAFPAPGTAQPAPQRAVRAPSLHRERGAARPAGARVSERARAP